MIADHLELQHHHFLHKQLKQQYYFHDYNTHNLQLRFAYLLLYNYRYFKNYCAIDLPVDLPSMSLHSSGESHSSQIKQKSIIN